MIARPTHLSRPRQGIRDGSGPPILSLGEAMSILGVSRAGIERLQRQGALKDVRLSEGGEPLIRRRDITALLNARQPKVH